METINTELNTTKDAIFLEAMQVFKNAVQVADAFVSKYHQLEYPDGIRLISIEEASRRLNGLNRREVKKLYDEGRLKGYRKNNSSIAIRSDSVEDYIRSLDKIMGDEYFTNEQKVMQKAKASITRSEIEKYGGVKQMAKIDKKEKHFFKHDLNARNDEKIKKLRIKHRSSGYGVYQILTLN